MNDADKRAFEEWKVEQFQKGEPRLVPSEAWQAACKWRDSQNAQINQQLMEALQGLLDREWQDDEGDPRLDATRVKAKAALAAAKETK